MTLDRKSNHDYQAMPLVPFGSLTLSGTEKVQAINYDIGRYAQASSAVDQLNPHHDTLPIERYYLTPPGAKLAVL